MSLKTVFVLLRKEIISNAKNFMVVYIVIMPVVLSLLVTLVFGEIFSTTPDLGFVNEGNNPMFAELISDVDFVDITEYENTGDMTYDVEIGAIDIGVVIPDGFEESITSGEQVDLHLYVWAERMGKDEFMLNQTLGDLFIGMAGYEQAVAVEPVMLGEYTESMTWQQRLIPFLTLMAVVLSGLFIPAMSLVDEKEKKTLKALVVTPVSMEDIFISKGIFGVIMSMVVAAIILMLNQMFSASTIIILTTLFIGGIAAAAGGLIFGSYVKDTVSLMAIIKATGLILYAPGLIKIFPDVPNWIAEIFPTYYMIGPIIEVTQNGGGWADVTKDLDILTAMAIVLIGVALMRAKQVRYQPMV
jgi:ABC-2 type transport system permease protein